MALHTVSLFAGVGGLDLAVGLARECRVVCYVERECYAASVLAARMADATLDEAPVWSDVTTFDGKPWRGAVDLITASPTVSPERERDSMTNEAAPSSNTSPESSRKSRPDWSSWKTSGSGGQADFFASSESSYSDWVTESLRRSRLLRETLAHRIDGSAGGAWPTAQTHDGEGWPGKGTRERGGRQACLNVAVTTWPTPNARDHKGSLPLDARDRTMGTLDEAAERIFSLPPQTTPLTGQPSSQSNQNAPRRLNPIFVEWLMGWPPHYTNAQIALDAQAMASYRFAARSHFTSLCRTPGYRSPKNGGQNDCG